MTQPLPSETVDYERYVDGLRRSNVELVSALRNLLTECEDRPVHANGQPMAPMLSIQGAQARKALADAHEVLAKYGNGQIDGDEAAMQRAGAILDKVRGGAV